jgi:ferritin
MAAFCELHKFAGAARWLKHQSVEERQHALKLFDFVLARNAAVELEALPAPTVEFKDVADVFVAALLQEEQTTAQINEVSELAFVSKAFTEMAELQWFLTEQVEEEQTARHWVARFQLVANDPGALLDLDRELGARSSTT